ncbi:hypothetical protein CDAR_400641 [Caerostris darwini]|uniref:Autophagy-related protein n=1 Tax=Caerostris darwini TaxID=1538125 RepID=A0AAV4NC70_9ARAC|nr:hypothetical protein CDAR_400641 [Caerostris darwini]
MFHQSQSLCLTENFVPPTYPKMIVIGDDCPNVSFGNKKSYKAVNQRSPFSYRNNLANEMKAKFPNRIPVIVERASNEQVFLNLDTDKFLVPENISYFHFAALSRSRLNIRNHQPFCISVNKMCLKSIFKGAQGNQLMGDMYRENPDDDGFLYFVYSSS